MIFKIANLHLDIINRRIVSKNREVVLLLPVCYGIPLENDQKCGYLKRIRWLPSGMLGCNMEKGK